MNSIYMQTWWNTQIYRVIRFYISHKNASMQYTVIRSKGVHIQKVCKIGKGVYIQKVCKIGKGVYIQKVRSIER
jgi:UDP-3-O-[3-hydroxymyristoyl] glucosamine N-acyltransferase